jgi:hypothetical protein
VVAAIAGSRGQAFVPAAFPSVKFLNPLLPDGHFDVRISGDGPRFDFECVASGRVLVRGTVVGREPAAP